MRAPAKGSIQVSPTWSGKTRCPLAAARCARGENGAPPRSATAWLGFGGRGIGGDGSAGRPAGAACPGAGAVPCPGPTEDAMTYETLELRREGAVLWCTLNRPEALNTFSAKFVEEYHDLLDALAGDPATRIVVLRGAGRAFCAGLDLKETGFAGDGGVSASLRGQQRISQIALKMRRLPQVFVACVHGPACGGGFMLALASDIRIAGESARMNAAFIKLGLSGCDVGVSYLLPRLVGARGGLGADPHRPLPPRRARPRARARRGGGARRRSSRTRRAAGSPTCCARRPSACASARRR